MGPTCPTGHTRKGPVAPKGGGASYKRTNETPQYIRAATSILGRKSYSDCCVRALILLVFSRPGDFVDFVFLVSVAGLNIFIVSGSTFPFFYKYLYVMGFSLLT